MKKPELLIAAGSIQQMKRYVEAGANAVQVGEARFGMRLPGDMQIEELKRAVPWAHERGVKVYAVVNKIMENHQLDELQQYIADVHAAGVDALVFGDPAVIMAMRQAGVSLPLHWNAEMTSTNYETARYWKSKGSVRMITARELNMEEMIETAEVLRGEMEVQVQVHGLTNIYHSKRDLLTVYKEHLGSGDRALLGKLSGNAEEGMFLIEQERPDERFPIYEDAGGTHIMSSDDICLLDVLDELLAGGLASMKIEPLLKSEEYNETVLRSYRAAIDAYCAGPDQYAFQEEWLDAVKRLQDPRRELSYGFSFKQLVY